MKYETKYWLISFAFSPAEHTAHFNKAIWDLPLLLGDARFSAGDFVLLADSSGVGACGFVNAVGEPDAENVVWVKFAKVMFGAQLIPRATFVELGLEALLNFRGSHFQYLTRSQIVSLAGRVSLQIPLPRRPEFVLGEIAYYDEDLYTEYKELKGGNPTISIPNDGYERAVGFLNREGGRIFWGIRDSDKQIVGFSASTSQRDEIRRVLVQKLFSIVPEPRPTDFSIEFHLVTDPSGSLVPDLSVLELEVKSGNFKPYQTSGGRNITKTDSGIKRN